MKKFLFLLVALVSGMATACQPSGNNVNNGVNQNAGSNINQSVNINAPVNTNVNAGITAVDKDDKGVAVIIQYKADGTTKEILVTQSTIKVKKNRQKLRFIVINNLDEDIGDVTMPFKTTDPFDGTPFVAKGPTKAGETKDSQVRKAKNANGTYKYSVIVNGTDGKPLPGLPPLDPQVEIVD